MTRLPDQTPSTFIFELTVLLNGSHLIEVRTFDGIEYSEPVSRNIYVGVSIMETEDPGETVESTATTILIILVIIITCFVLVAIAALLRDDVRMNLYSRFLTPLLIIAGKDYMVRDTVQKDVYNLIRQLPGITYSRLLHDLHLDNATLIYQLSRLSRENLIEEKNRNGIVSFSPYYITTIRSSAKAMPPMSPVEKHILENLRRLGPAARCEIENTLQLSQPNVRENLSRLKARGLVDYDGEGKWAYCWAVNNPPKMK